MILVDGPSRDRLEPLPVKNFAVLLLIGTRTERVLGEGRTRTRRESRFVYDGYPIVNA